MELRGRNMKKLVESESSDGGDQTGDQSGIVKDSDTDKFQSEQRGRNGCSEQCGKDCRHPA